MAIKRRSTHIQQDIRDVLLNSSDALSHSDVELRLTVNADRATIFRVLNRMVEDGLAHKIISDDGKSYFAACHNGCNKEHHYDEHSHFRCVQCNKLLCLNDKVSNNIPDYYQILHTNIVITGVCPFCR
jgi:Fur family ferric uptake transcriptional regulator